LVADAKASTPTKAGVTAVPDKQEVLRQLVDFEKSLCSKAQWKLRLCEECLQTILASAVFRNPLLPVHNAEQQLDELQMRLGDLTKRLLGDARERLHRSYYQIVRIEPHRLLGEKKLALSDLKSRVDAAIRSVVTMCRLGLTAHANRLAGLNPKTALERGYSITTKKKTGSLVLSLDDVRKGDLLVTEVAGENLIESKVTRKQNRSGAD
jgi:exodeoxyribonuclease VII large subunit